MPTYEEEPMDLHDTLLAYSEWLDSQGLIVPDTEGYTRNNLKPDGRSHDQLARDFVKEWSGAPLVGSSRG